MVAIDIVILILFSPFILIAGMFVFAYLYVMALLLFMIAHFAIDTIMEWVRK